MININICDGDILSGDKGEYTIRQAAAGNWCVDVDVYGKETATYISFDTAEEAYSFAKIEDGGQLETVGNIYDEE